MGFEREESFSFSVIFSVCSAENRFFTCPPLVEDYTGCDTGTAATGLCRGDTDSHCVSDQHRPDAPQPARAARRHAATQAGHQRDADKEAPRQSAGTRQSAGLFAPISARRTHAHPQTQGLLARRQPRPPACSVAPIHTSQLSTCHARLAGSAWQPCASAALEAW